MQFAAIYLRIDNIIIWETEKGCFPFKKVALYMLRGNYCVGIAIFISILCLIAVFIIADRDYQANEMQFPQVPTLSEQAVDLNTATCEELDTLDGVGESTALKIIEFREKVRPFETVNDLTLIKGFGTKKLEKLLGYVYVK